MPLPLLFVVVYFPGVLPGFVVEVTFSMTDPEPPRFNITMQATQVDEGSGCTTVTNTTSTVEPNHPYFKSRSSIPLQPERSELLVCPTDASVSWGFTATTNVFGGELTIDAEGGVNCTTDITTPIGERL